jgi:hypothetical protein
MNPSWRHRDRALVEPRRAGSTHAYSSNPYISIQYNHTYGIIRLRSQTICYNATATCPCFCCQRSRRRSLASKIVTRRNCRPVDRIIGRMRRVGQLTTPVAGRELSEENKGKSDKARSVYQAHRRSSAFHYPLHSPLPLSQTVTNPPSQSVPTPSVYTCIHLTLIRAPDMRYMPPSVPRGGVETVLLVLVL